jgi:hypothetical protein
MFQELGLDKEKTQAAMVEGWTVGDMLDAYLPFEVAEQRAQPVVSREWAS